MNDNENKYILCGGPAYEPLHITEDCKSVGELFLKRFYRHGNNIVLVRFENMVSIYAGNCNFRCGFRWTDVPELS